METNGTSVDRFDVFAATCEALGVQEGLHRIGVLLTLPRDEAAGVLADAAEHLGRVGTEEAVVA